MTRAPRILHLFVFSLIAIAGTSAQQPQPAQMASLHPDQQLHWQRTSPTAQQPEGPVLYQLLFNASGTAGTVPAFDTNPRHLTNSPITISSGNVVIGGGSGLSISGTTGIVTFATGQTFPSTGVNSVAAGNNFIVIGGTAINPTIALNTVNTDTRYLSLTGGTMTGAITFGAGQTFPASGLPNLAGEVTGPPGTTVVSNAVSANTANAVVRRDGSGNFSAGTVTLSGVLALPDTTLASVGMLTLGGAPFLHDYPGASSQNTFVGSAGNLTMTGAFNAALGSLSFNANTTGFYNAAFGQSSLQSNTTGTQNAAFGTGALKLNTSASSNSAFGAFALNNNTTGGNNSAFGQGALAANTINQNNAAFGQGALRNNNDPGTVTNASNNSAFGINALFNNTTGIENSAFGTFALQSNTTAGASSAFGYNALTKNTATGSSAFGYNALRANTSGIDNSAFGSNALSNNTTGTDNSAFGLNALFSNGTGFGNAAFGTLAMQNNIAGGNNAAFGYGALAANNGNANSAVGFDALQQNTGGQANVAMGYGALSGLTTGSFNVALGYRAGVSLTGSESSNIYMDNTGVLGESNTVRIGDGSTQTAVFITGINGATSASGMFVFVNSSGQLGTATSSRRYKHEIANMEDESSVLMKLRPVAFYYKPELDPTQTRQYGLVAEEVAQIAPSLVVFDKDGQPQTVRYHFVNAMLLNEVQKQRRLIEAQQQQIDHLNAALESQQAAQQEQIAALREEVKAMRDLLQKPDGSSLAKLAGGGH